jgi:serine/threonine-protein kinase
MFTQLLTTAPIPLKDAKDDLTFNPALDAVVMKALSRNPGDRYPSVKAFAEAFREAAALPVEQAGVLSKFKGLLRRNK